MIGRSIGNYKILEKLSRTEEIGIYKAVDLLLNRNVVVKTLEREFLHRPEIAESFRYESAILSKLDHKSIPHLYSMTAVDDELFMISEFLDGETLDRILLRDVKLSFEKCVAVFTQVFDCVEYTHKNGVAHGSLKNSNIMLTDDGNVKILGYGASETNSTRTKKNISDKENDIHALAWMLYESLTGKKSFDAGESSDRNLSHTIESVIKRSLLTNSTKRFKSVTEFRTALISAGFAVADDKTKPSEQKISADAPKSAVKSAKANSESKFIIINPIAVSEDAKSIPMQQSESIQIKPLKLKNRARTTAAISKKAGQKRYMFAAAAIVAVLVLHSFWQFSYIQSENLRTAKEIMKTIQSEKLLTEVELLTPPALPKVEPQATEEKSGDESKKSDIFVAEKTSQSERAVQRANYRQNEVKSAPPVIAPPVTKKKAAPESKNERLRRAEKLLTGM
jgi:serine/threonine protein kinase